MRRFRTPLATALLAAASVFAAGCDLASTNEPITVTTDRIAYDFRVGSLVAGRPVTLSAASPVSLAGLIPGGFAPSEITDAQLESVQVEQIVPSGAVYTLGSVQNLAFSLNGQTVATNAAPLGTTAALTPTGGNVASLLASGTLAGTLAYTPTATLGEDYALRVSFVARVVVRNP